MRKVFTFFSTVNNRLHILVKKTKIPSLPTNLDLVGKRLSRRDCVEAFFLYSEKTEDIPGCEWRELLSINEFSGTDGAIVCEGLGELFPLFSRSKFHIPELFLKKEFNHEAVTFFGGSFYPWHKGHSECLRRCPSSNIVIIPDRNPWKEKIKVGCFFRSLMSLAKKFEFTNYSIFPGFYGREEANPTVSWLPRTTFSRKSLLIGDDNFCSLLRWEKASELILNLDELFVLNRQHSKEELDATNQEILAINKSLEVTFLGEHDYMNLSSSELRAKKEM